MGRRKPGEPGHESGRPRGLGKKTWLILGPTIGAGRVAGRGAGRSPIIHSGSQGVSGSVTSSRSPGTLGSGVSAGRASGLTQRARKVFEFIMASVSEKGLPPTIREIGKQFKISSTNGVRYYLGVLEKAGYIKRTGKISRGIEIRREWADSLHGESRGVAAASAQATGGIESKTAGSWTGKWMPPRLLESVEIPIVGRVAAGAPILAEENIEDFIAVDKSIARSGKLFALRVRGDSMKESGLLDGDLAIVRQQHHADSGDIVVALLGDEATVKRFVRRDARPGSGRESEVILKPENKEYRPIVVRDGMQFSLIGKVVGSIRKY